MKKTNGCSQRILTNATLPEYREEATPERSKQHSKEPSHKHGMMRKQVLCMSGLKRHGKVQKTKLQIKWSSICNEVKHILEFNGTPHQLFSSLPVRYSTILKVVKHGKR